MKIDVLDFKSNKIKSEVFNSNIHRLVLFENTYIFAKNLPKEYKLSNGLYIKSPNNHILLKNFPYIYPYDFTYSSSGFIDKVSGCLGKIPKSRNKGDSLKYSFGLEFETCCGYVPMHECLDKGLIPLRDGSIAGIEYVTIPFSGSEGISRLKSVVDILRETTAFDKECALHIHFGGFPVKEDKIYALYKLLYGLQQPMNYMFGWDWAYNTQRYKRNEKNYCSSLPYLNSFEELYSYLVGRPYFGNLYQPHPYDLENHSKWNIRSRYYMCNFINMLCFNKAKTIEFRFLRPTYHWGVIQFWIYLFNNILQYAEQYTKEIIATNVDDINYEKLILDLSKDIPNSMDVFQVANLRKSIKDSYGAVDQLNYLYIPNNTFK